MAEEFTPGPWWGEQDGAGVIILAKVGPIRVSPARANSEADAHLIAAAPDLYRAVKFYPTILRELADGAGKAGRIDLADDLRMHARDFEALLAKARGE